MERRMEVAFFSLMVKKCYTVLFSFVHSNVEGCSRVMGNPFSVHLRCIDYTILLCPL